MANPPQAPDALRDVGGDEEPSHRHRWTWDDRGFFVCTGSQDDPGCWEIDES